MIFVHTFLSLQNPSYPFRPILTLSKIEVDRNKEGPLLSSSSQRFSPKNLLLLFVRACPLLNFSCSEGGSQNPGAGGDSRHLTSPTMAD